MKPRKQYKIKIKKFVESDKNWKNSIKFFHGEALNSQIRKRITSLREKSLRFKQELFRFRNEESF